MDMPINSEDNRHMIQLKTCPRCKTAIRRSQRYGNVIKQQLLDIVKVKAKVNGNQDEIETTREDLKKRLQVLRPKFAAENGWSVLMKRVNKISNSVVAAVVTVRTVRTVSEPKRAPQNAGKEALSRKRMARRYE